MTHRRGGTSTVAGSRVLPRAVVAVLALSCWGGLACSEESMGPGAGGSTTTAFGGRAGSAGTGAAAGSGASAGSGGAAGAGGIPVDLCANPTDNLFAHGTFEGGMSGLAPAFWEVRTPGMPTGACMDSGSPDQHVFLTAPPPGCAGSALAIDARGQWDCYAIQRVSDYGSIEGGATYRISTVARSEGNSENPAAWFIIGAQWLDEHDAFFGDEKNPETASAADNDFDYKVISFDVVAPSNARRILVWLTGHFPGRVDYDNVAVVKQ